MLGFYVSVWLARVKCTWLYLNRGRAVSLHAEHFDWNVFVMLAPLVASLKKRGERQHMLTSADYFSVCVRTTNWILFIIINNTRQSGFFVVICWNDPLRRSCSPLLRDCSPSAVPRGAFPYKFPCLLRNCWMEFLEQLFSFTFFSLSP